jgi:hypothetical protein
MNNTCKMILGSIIALTLLTVSGHAQAGPKDRYSVVTLVNETPYRVDYSYQWGSGSRWYSNYIKPNSRYVHWWTFDYAGQDYAPYFYIELEGDSSSYRLRSFYSPDKEADNGRVYYIRFDDDQEKFAVYGKLYTD